MLTLNKSSNTINKTPFWETGCLGIFFRLFFYFFFECLGIQFFDSPLPPLTQSGYLWLPTPHCAAPVWLTGRHVMPLVTRCFPPQPFNVIPHPSMSYRQVFRPILYFQPSSLQSDSRLCPTHPSMWLKGHHATPEATYTYLRARRISIGVRSILDICLHSHI